MMSHIITEQQAELEAAEQCHASPVLFDASARTDQLQCSHLKVDQLQCSHLSPVLFDNASAGHAAPVLFDCHHSESDAKVDHASPVRLDASTQTH
eukprot:676176-Karenia_brevis.AAC.1